MKGIFKGITAISCAALMAFGFVACNEKEIVNAYDIAVKNGFVGTEQEWLESLKGANGKDGEDLDIQDVYEASGYQGDLLGFISEYLKVDVQEDNDVETLAQNVLSVVSIYCGFTKTVETNNGWPLFGTSTETQVYCSAGSGVILDLNQQAGSAYIVTNYHVIYDMESDAKNKISNSIYVYTYGALNGFSTTTGKDENGDGMLATFVGGAMDYDIAILKVEGKKHLQTALATEAKIGQSNNVQLGEKVFAVGNPEGAGISVTAGVLSVDSEYIAMSSTDGANRSVSYRVMRTDAAINSGNSGGALFNAQGELIGITNAKNVDDGVDNMGYALPITQVVYLMENLFDNGGVVKRAMLGITVSLLDSEAVYVDGMLTIKETLAVDSTKIETTAAAYGKLRYMDKLVSIKINDGETVTLNRKYHLNDLLLTVRKGDTLTLGIIRDGKEQTVAITYNNDAYFTTYA